LYSTGVRAIIVVSGQSLIRAIRPPASPCPSASAEASRCRAGSHGGRGGGRGFGFLESVYQNAFVIELTKADLKVEQEKSVQVSYDGQVIGDFTADVVVEEKVILELKSVKQLHPAHEAQLINYLKATGFEVGLLINFGEKVEIKRKVLDHT
ncbi:unnamed protein product, partial [marine sediment metagenome]